MISRSIVLTAFLAASLATSHPQAPAASTASTPAAVAKPAAAADPYRDEPAVFERLDSTVRMHADGTGETITHVVLRVQSEGTARQFSVLSVSYASANATGTIDFVRVHKADGTTVETPTADAMEMPSEVTREAPVYSDIREKHLPVRSLSSGDRLEYQFRVTHTKAEAPGQFWGAEHFALDGVILGQTVSLEVPADTYVQVWSPNHPATPVTKDGVKVWTWTSSQATPSQRDAAGKMTAADVKDPDEDADGRKLPSVAWTTFRNWAQVGDWYRGLALQRADPTDAIKAKAAELTKDAKTPEEQVQALYHYVATQTRYVGISLGVGRYQPHAAADVMANQYGDCKDKDTLLEALLKAKGFTTAPALIGAGIIPVADVPSPAVFNHVITTVTMPGSTTPIWLDTTAEVEPYRVLIPSIRDQFALVIPSTGDAKLEKTPADPPFPYREEFNAVATLDKDGLLKGHMQYTVRSDNELGFRILLQRAAPAQWDSAIQYVSQGIGFGGKVSNADLRQNDPTGPVKISYDYTRESFGDWKNNRIVPLFPALEVAVVDKDKAPEHDIDLGAPRTLQAHTTITLPDGYRAELPEAVHVRRAYTTFDQTYRLIDSRLTVDRTVVILQRKLPKAQWKEYVAFSKQIGMEDGEAFIALITPSTTIPSLATSRASGASITPAVSADDLDTASAQQLKDRAQALEKENDWTGARRYAEKAKERFPDEPYVRSMVAYVDAHEKRYDDAIAGYKAELAAHSDETNVVRLLAGVYFTQKRYSDAISLLQGYRSRKDINIEKQLVYAQDQNGDQEAALKTIHEAIEDMPNDEYLPIDEVKQLRRMHREDEAAAVARQAIDNTKNPDILNSHAYFLAEMKQDLPLAESTSRRSLEMFDRINSTGAVEEANARAFSLSAQMVNAWDTLGDILMIEDKPKAAEPYLLASWFELPDPVKGAHLAEVYEKLDRKSDARWIDTLTLSMAAPSYTAERATLQEREERLKKQGVPLPAGKPVTMQEMRTFHLKNSGSVQGSSTVRLQLGGAGIIDSTIVAGDASLKPLLTELQHLNIPPAVPPASPAHVLRDGVLFCGKDSKDCEFVLMERSGIALETSPK